MRDTVAQGEAHDKTEVIGSYQREARRFRCIWQPLVGFLARTKSLATEQGDDL